MFTDDIGFMFLGKTVEEANSDNALKVPAPDGAPFESEWAFDGMRNGVNTLRGTFVGRDIDKQNCSWTLIKPEDWWSLNRFRRANRNIFYCRYFSHNLGYWFTRQFYMGNPKVEPKVINKKTHYPDVYYHNASLNFIDTGEVE